VPTLLDLDPRKGHVRLAIFFGPNEYMGYANERGVSNYSVFLTDRDGKVRLRDGVRVAQVAARGLQHRACCQDDMYSREVSSSVPGNYSFVRLEVVPEISGSGPLPVGEVTGIFEDWFDPARVRAMASATIGLQRPSLWYLFFAMLVWQPGVSQSVR